MMGMPGIQELLIIAAICLLLFGSRLPKVMGSLGQGITEFKKGVAGLLPDEFKPRDDDPSFGNDPNYEPPRNVDPGFGINPKPPRASNDTQLRD